METVMEIYLFNDTAKRIVWRISPHCVLGACYAFVVSFFVKDCYLF